MDKPPLRLSPYAVALPLRVIGLAKEAALGADWSLARWEEFKRTAFACLSEDASPEETALFLEVVRERFDVTI